MIVCGSNNIFPHGTHSAAASIRGFEATNLIRFFAGCRSICIARPNTTFCRGGNAFLVVRMSFAMLGIFDDTSAFRRLPVTMLNACRTFFAVATDTPASLATSALSVADILADNGLSHSYTHQLHYTEFCVRPWHWMRRATACYFLVYEKRHLCRQPGNFYTPGSSAQRMNDSEEHP